MIASSGRLGHVLICASFVLLLLPVRGAAQECTGRTAYLVRDEAGRVLSNEQMRDVRIVSLEGITLPLVRDADGQWYYVYRHSATQPEIAYDERVVDLRNPLVFGIGSGLNHCGRIGDLVLSYRGKEMRLLFDLRRGVHYDVDSPPFQNGTFHLRGPFCPHPDDRDSSGRCVVSSDRWDGMDKEWVRHPVPVFIGGGRLAEPVAACRSATVRAVTRRSEWDALWRSHPGVVRSNRPLEFDFRTQVMLVAYLPIGNFGLTLESVRVDKSGDLTFAPMREPPDPQSCSVVIVVIYRSGVRSIEGAPLPSGETPARS